MPRFRITFLMAFLALSLTLSCATSPEPAVVPEVSVAAEIAPPTDESLAETYARHVRELTEEDISLGRLIVRIGESIGEAGSSGEMLLRERTLERLVMQVKALREGRLRVLEFWERVREQWPGMATLDERAALELLGERAITENP